VAILSRSTGSLPNSTLPVHHKTYHCDVSNSSQVITTIKQIEEEMGPVGVLVNAAGIAKDSLLVHVKDIHLQEVMGTNVMGTVYTTRAVVKSMMKHKYGVIINIGSVVGLTGGMWDKLLTVHLNQH